MRSFALFTGYLLTIPAANWLVGNLGTTCVPDGPCLIPVGFGFMAPSGVLMVGLSLFLRDLLHEALGWKAALAAIVGGSVLSLALASPELAVASLLAFALSELLDQAVYTPLRRRRLVAAVIASGVVGAAVDSVLFVYLAFGSLDHAAGQIVGKTWMVLIGAILICLVRNRFTRTVGAV